MKLNDEIIRINWAKNNIKDAINLKGGEIFDEPLSDYAGVLESLNNIENQGAPEVNHQVRFIDYDGTVLSVQKLPMLSNAIAPQVPDHSSIGLIFNRWNNTYNDILRTIDVGAIYDTVDNKSYIHIIINKVTDKYFNSNIIKSGSGNVIIDWGDGTGNMVISTNTKTAINHIYAEYGEYIITMSSDENTTYRFEIDHISVNGVDTLDLNYFVTKAFLSKQYDLKKDSGLLGATYMTLPSNMMGSITENTFRSFTNLVSISIPSGINNSVEAEAFFYCINLESLILPQDMVGEIGHSAFYKLLNLEFLIIPPNMVGSINYYTFYQMSKVRFLILPKYMNGYIGEYAFYGMSKLIYLVLPWKVTNFITDYALAQLTSLKTLILPQIEAGIRLGINVFENMNSITNFTIPKGVTSLDNNEIMKNMQSLEFLSIPEGITGTLGANLLWGCDSIKEIYIPQGINRLKDTSLWGMSSCMTFDFKDHTAVPVLENHSGFNRKPNKFSRILVPSALYDSWIAAENWSLISDNIEAV